MNHLITFFTVYLFFKSNFTKNAPEQSYALVAQVSIRKETRHNRVENYLRLDVKK